MDRAVFEAGRAGKLQVVANAAVGYDNIDVPSAQDVRHRGVQHAGSARRHHGRSGLPPHPGGGAPEHPGRGGPPGGTLDRAGASTPTWPATSTGRRSGWSGYGRIGRAVARRAAGFDMEVLHTTRRGHRRSRLRGVPARAVAAFGHRQPPCAAERFDPSLDRRAGAGPDETDGRPGQHGTRTGRRRERAGRRARGRDALCSGARRVRRRAGRKPPAAEGTAGQRFFLTSAVQRSARALAWLGLACQGVADVLAGRTPPNLIVPTIRAV